MDSTAARHRASNLPASDYPRIETQRVSPGRMMAPHQGDGVTRFTAPLVFSLGRFPPVNYVVLIPRRFSPRRACCSQSCAMLRPPLKQRL